MKAKRMAVWALALLAAAEWSLAFDAAEKAVLRGAGSEMESAFRSAPALDGKAITLLPVRGDEDAYAEGLILEVLVKAGKTAVVSNDEKHDVRFKRILEEIRWDEVQTRLASIDPATIDELGRLKSTQLLLEADLDVHRSAGSLLQGRSFGAELVLLAYDVETKQYVWAGRFILPADDGGWHPAFRISEITSPRLVRVASEVTAGEGAERVADRVDTFVRGMLAEMGYWVDSSAKADLTLALHTERETFDESGQWIVYDGTIKVRLHLRGADDRLVGETDIDARGLRGLGETQASRNLADVLEAELSVWMKGRLRADLVRMEALDLQLYSDSRQAEEIRKTVAAIPGVRCVMLDLPDAGHPAYVLHAVYDKEAFPGGLMHALLVKWSGKWTDANP